MGFETAAMMHATGVEVGRRSLSPGKGWLESLHSRRTFGEIVTPGLGRASMLVHRLTRL